MSFSKNLLEQCPHQYYLRIQSTCSRFLAKAESIQNTTIFVNQTKDLRAAACRCYRVNEITTTRAHAQNHAIWSPHTQPVIQFGVYEVVDVLRSMEISFVAHSLARLYAPRRTGLGITLPGKYFSVMERAF